MLNTLALRHAPRVVKIFLDSLTGGFDIANKGENWQVSDVVLLGENLPSRSLVYMGTGENITLLKYNTGGLGVTDHVLIVKHEKGRVIDFWKGIGPFEASSKLELIKHLKSNGLNSKGLYDRMFFLYRN